VPSWSPAATAEQSQPVPDIVTTVSPVGRVSVTVVATADGPALVTVRVKVTSVPAIHGPALTVFAIDTAASVRTSVGSSSRLLLASSSSGPLTCATLTRPSCGARVEAIAVVRSMTIVDPSGREAPGAVSTVQLSS